jgi:2-furoyl-CoA dehydrogenase large subunit
VATGGSGPWVGRELERVEDRALLDGTARFVADLEPVGRALHAAILRSTHAHAVLAGIDSVAALAIPGVRAVVTGESLTEVSRPLANILDDRVVMYPLAVGKVRYVGEPVALVLADSRAVAEDGADAVTVTYEVLDAVADPASAVEPYAALIHDTADSNLVHDRSFVFGEPDAAFDEAAHVVSHRSHFPRSTALPLETYGITAEFDPGGGGYTIWSNYGGPMALQTVMAGALMVPISGLRLVVPERIGGNFGIKQAMYPYMVLMAAAARIVGRPVRWMEDRNEHLLSSSAGSERVTEMVGAFDGEGRLRALRIDQLENLGAYVRTPEPAGLYRMHGNLNGPYDVQHIAVRNRCVLTNQVPSGLNRGFGGPQFFHALEAMFDRAAAQLGLDRAEVRRRNLVPADAFPYECASGASLDSGDYEAVLDRALARAGWGAALGHAADAREEGRLVGVGLACSVESAGNNLGYMNLAGDPESPAVRSPKSGAGATATLSIDAFGGVTVQLDSPDCGQGYRTAAAQIAADELGLRPDDVHVQTSLDSTADGWTLTSGNYANRFSTAVASAVAMAARRAGEKLRALAASNFGVHPTEIELDDGVARQRGTDRSEPIRRLGGQLHWDIANRPDGVDGPIRETGVYAPAHLGAPVDGRISSSFTFSFQCDVAAVEIDPRTGVLDITSYVTVHDAGRLLNPGLFEGQVVGGLAHGLGAAIREEIAYDSTGAPSAVDLRAYGPLLAAEMPPVTVDHLETPSPNTLHGAKGLGDGCAILAPTVIASAIADALGLDEMPEPPFTPARLWRLVREAAG